MGSASSKSRPLPWGTPSTTSISTMSASSLAAIQCAEVAPTLPAPTMVTFFRILLLRHHIFDDPGREFARLGLRGPRHLPFKVVGYIFLLNGLLERGLDQFGGLAPTEEFKQHHAREHHRARID